MGAPRHKFSDWHRWLNFSYGRNLTLSLVHLDLAVAKISASASQVTPLAELIEMVQYGVKLM